MGIVKNLTKKEIESIQIDEGVVILDYGEVSERVLAPCRGGGEFTAKVTIRDIEFDGRNGKTAGMQVIEEQEADLKVTTISLTPENLEVAMPAARVSTETIPDPHDHGGDKEVTTIKNPKMGYLEVAHYLTNVTMFAKLVGGSYKKITIHKPMTEDGISLKASPKAEGELTLDFHAHYGTDDLDGDLWEITEIDEFSMRRAASNSTVTVTEEPTENNP